MTELSVEYAKEDSGWIQIYGAEGELEEGIRMSLAFGGDGISVLIGSKISVLIPWDRVERDVMEALDKSGDWRQFLKDREYKPTPEELAEEERPNNIRLRKKR